MTTSTDTQSHTDAQAPSFQPVNSIELVSTENSNITSVSVYSGRAEITRVFKVEGRGAATIHDVTVSNIDDPQSSATSSTIQELTSKQAKTTKALERCKTAISSLESYLATMDVKTIDVGSVRQVVKEYDTTAEELDNRVLELEAQLEDIGEELDKERASLNGPKPNDKLRKRVVVGVFADVEREVEIVLIYGGSSYFYTNHHTTMTILFAAVHGASWTAGYDIRVNTHTYEEPVSLIYKASITQRTGEDWTDIPLTLETATPTFGLNVPTLNPWNLSIYKPSPPVPIHPVAFAQPPPPAAPSMAHKSSLRSVASRSGVSLAANLPMPVRGLDVVPSNGKGNCDNCEAELGGGDVVDLRAEEGCEGAFEFFSLQAKIKNASQYTLLRGTGSVYVDGSFISRSEVPSVSPEESFNCPLGLDPSIRVTYHPISKTRSESGFYTKTTTHVYTQNVTVFNTKPTPVERVRVVDQVPVSEDAQVQVRLLSPSLPAAGSARDREEREKENGKDKDKGQGEGGKKLMSVAVASGVSAMWEGADDGEGDGELAARNGKLSWVVALPGKGKANLVLKYEVGAPAGANVVGLP
ncbi:hypothetical protein C0992_010561 [Termitomyces sp. T32_za158]|nr:hypothetical protein C0992_010561 [Termitomyces sp. T32_za158]